MDEIGTFNAQRQESVSSTIEAANLAIENTAFYSDLEAVITAVIAGDFTRRLVTNHGNPDLKRLTLNVNEMVASIDKGFAEIGRVMAALAEGDLNARMCGEYRGSFVQLQKNTNLALANVRSVLGQTGADRFAENSTRFGKLIARFRIETALPAVRISDQASKPVISPARTLGQKLARAFSGSSEPGTSKTDKYQDRSRM